MIGAIAGDMIGSPYEIQPIKHTDFDPVVSRFTDDTVLTCAVAYAILNDADMAASLKKFAQKHHALPYGQAFYKKIPEPIVETVRHRLPADLREVLDGFNRKFGCAF